jgi:hypothetical protein
VPPLAAAACGVAAVVGLAAAACFFLRQRRRARGGAGGAAGGLAGRKATAGGGGWGGGGGGGGGDYDQMLLPLLQAQEPTAEEVSLVARLSREAAYAPGTNAPANDPAKQLAVYRWSKGEASGSGVVSLPYEVLQLATRCFSALHSLGTGGSCEKQVGRSVGRWVVAQRSLL